MNNGETIKGLYEAFAKGDVPAVLAAMDPLINWTEAEGFLYGGNYIGPDAILENVFAKLGTEWEQFSAVPGQFVEEGNVVVALGTYSGRYLATDKSISVPFAHAWTLRDGKITRFQQYTDTLVIARDLGL
ncbi:MAG TPA: nuclear transport factor 2 family protein [Pyrinomonadaceae bacterium]|nr:nuclear transport factor 2 family protein [Pyrinomonadaceae bacterium]